jgi:hypothetical protein
MKTFKYLQRLACNPWRRNVSTGIGHNSERHYKMKGWSYVNQGMIESFALKVRIFDAAFSERNFPVGASCASCFKANGCI